MWNPYVASEGKTSCKFLELCGVNVDIQSKQIVGDRQISSLISPKTIAFWSKSVCEKSDVNHTFEPTAVQPYSSAIHIRASFL